MEVITISIRREKEGAYLRGEGESGASYVRRIRAYLEYLENTSGVHQGWYTHRNTAGCWICDSLLLARRTVEELDRLYKVEEEDIKDRFDTDIYQVPPKDT